MQSLSFPAMAEGMIVAADMKYLPGTQLAGAVDLEIPELGISPCSSHPEVHSEVLLEEQVCMEPSHAPIQSAAMSCVTSLDKALARMENRNTDD